MLMSNAAKTLQNVAAQIDNDITAPLIQHLFNTNNDLHTNTKIIVNLDIIAEGTNLQSHLLTLIHG